MYTKIERTKSLATINFETAQEADQFHDWYLDKGADLELCAPRLLEAEDNLIIVTFRPNDCLEADPINDLLVAMLSKFYGRASR